MYETVRVRDVMSPVPLTVDVEQTLSEARAKMSALDVRHLPVLAGERVVGMLSERDIGLAAGLGLTLEKVSVGAAMSAGPFIVAPDEELDVVLRIMADKKLGSAVVVRDERAVGVFTSTDGLRMLSRIVNHIGDLVRVEVPLDSVLQRLDRERAVLNSVKQSAREVALAALAEDETAVGELSARATELDQAALRYIELEEELLIPLLERSPAGAVRVDLMRERHQSVRRQIHMAHVALRHSDPEHLAYAVLNMCEI